MLVIWSRSLQIAVQFDDSKENRSLSNNMVSVLIDPYSLPSLKPYTCT